MQIRANEGWIRAGLAVLVTGVLGGGVVTLARDSDGTRKVTADGVTRPAGEAPAKPVDLVATPAAATDDKPKADPVVGDKVTVGSDGGSVTVSAVEDDVSAGRLFGAGPGQKYLAAEVKGCSGPHEKNLSFEPNYFLLMLDDGTMHDRGPGAKKPELEGGTVPAGKCLSGWVTFTVPTGSLPTAVLYDGSSRLTWKVPLPKGAHPTTTTTAKGGVTTTSTSPSGSSTTPSTGKSTTSTTTSKSATTTTGRTSTTAKSSSSSATTSTTKASSTSTTTGKSSSTTTTTKPAPTTSTTAGERSTPSTTEPKPVTPTPTTPPG
ncbi:MAG TPA: hypothetical protein VGO87_06160 [Acidimicrobiia bacterium]|jgi:hypothetical protein